jgi:N-acetylated-alpha-linked acidic dipeptidase
MDTYGDPGFHYHATISRLWALLAARIVETPVIQLNATDYAVGLKVYLQSVKDKALNTSAFQTEAGLPFNVSFKGLDFVVDKFHNASIDFDAEAAELLAKIQENPLPWWRWWEKIKLYRHVQKVNDKYKNIERMFLHKKGLDGRPWFKHVVFAPGIWTGYAGATFPGLVESIDKGDVGGVFKWMGVITKLIVNAANSLTVE